LKNIKHDGDCAPLVERDPAYPAGSALHDARALSGLFRPTMCPAL
jgi:hypothetical protein